MSELERIDQEDRFADLIDRFEFCLERKGDGINQLEFTALSMAAGIPTFRIHAVINRIRMLDGLNPRGWKYV